MSTPTATAPDVQFLAVDQVHPHPLNPGRHRITDENVAALAQSLEALGLQQPIKVRPHGQGRWQILFGERRWTAARQLGWTEIPAVVEACDDRRALELMGVENAQRVDLDPLAVAEHIAAMLREQPDGSPAMTQAEVATVYGISQGEVSNRVRLLRLPTSARKRIISGEMSVKQARQLVPLADAPELVEAVVADFVADLARPWMAGDWVAGEAMEHTVDTIVMDRVRPLAELPAQVELTDDLRQELQVVTLPIGERAAAGGRRQAVEVALNCERFDALLAAQPSRGGPASAQATDRPERTPQQEKAHQAEQAKARRARVKQLHEETRRRLLRVAIAASVELGDWRTALSAQAILATWARPAELVRLATWRAIGKKGKSDPDERLLRHLVAAASADGDEVTFGERVEAWVVRLALVPVDEWAVGCDQIRTQWDYPASDCLHWRDRLGVGLLDELAGLWEVHAGVGWAMAAKSSVEGAAIALAIVEQFLGYHRKGELEGLAKELGVDTNQGRTASGLRETILAAHLRGRLPLPACLGGAKPKRRRGKP